MTKQVLMLTAAWPPVARVGVRRPLRLARRLPDLGWQPIVMTPEPDSVFRKAPNLDPSLSVPDIEVHRVSALIPSTKLAQGLRRLPKLVAKPINRVISELLKPDQYPAWTRAAKRAARGLENIQCVWVTGGPFGMFCVGTAIAKQLNVPLILDYRDPWTVDLKRKRIPIGPSRRAIRKLEAKLLDSADAVSYVNTNMLARNVAAFSPGPSANWVVIPNGFDPTDVVFDKPTTHAIPTLVYAGACYGSRSMKPILETLHTCNAELPPLQLKIFGELDPAARRFLDRHPMPDRVSHGQRIPANELAPIMAGSAALLLIIGNEHKTALSAKIFDYLEMDRPIIGYGPPGSDAATLIKSCGVGRWSSDSDTLRDALFQIASDTVPFTPKKDALRRYSADMMAERTAALLDEVTGR